MYVTPLCELKKGGVLYQMYVIPLCGTLVSQRVKWDQDGASMLPSVQATARSNLYNALS